MTTLPVLDAAGATVASATLAGPIAAQEIKQHLIHETVVAELAHRRAGTSSTKNRSEVSGGGTKPWRQKGTGRARQGSIRAPQWTGGGIVHGPTPRSHGGKVNRKVRQQAFRAALRAHAERGSLALIDGSGFDVPSTRRAAAVLQAAPAGLAPRPLLVLVEDAGSAAARSFRNLPGVYLLEAHELETVDLVAARALLVERPVWERLSGAELELGAAPAAAPVAAAPAAATPAPDAGTPATATAEEGA